MTNNSASASSRDTPLAEIVVDPEIQQRANGIDEATLADYRRAADAADGWPFPPVTVFRDGDKYVLADGFHRYQVAVATGQKTLKADVLIGDRRDALLHAVGANSDHGLQRSNADKRRAVETLLADPEWQARSDHWIAEQCAVSQPFVSKVRGDLTNNGYQSKPAEPTGSSPDLTNNGYQSKPKPPPRKGRDGRTIKTANIGRKPALKPATTPPKPAAKAEPTAPPTTRAKPSDKSPALAAQHAMQAAYSALCDVAERRDAVERNPESAPGLVTIAREVLAWLGPVVDGMEGKGDA